MVGRVFVVDPKGIQSQKIIPSIKLTVTPNPALDYCRLKYFIPKSGIITVSLINQMGERIKELHPGQQSKGYYEMNISAPDFLSTGIFFIQFDIKNYNLFHYFCNQNFTNLFTVTRLFPFNTCKK